MEVYPALKARMGDTDYYTVRMRLDEIAKNVEVVGAPYEHSPLNDELQRKLDKGRVKNEIIQFLERPDRFFSSIVVATVGGSPVFHPVRISPESDGLAELFKGAGVDESFGLLVFKSGVRFYALDGQHRLSAIQTFLKEKRSPDISKDHISVVLIASQSDADKPLPEKETEKRRRLFSWLNRYAKKPGKETDIIMDEEDAFAILTRRLINDYPHFQPKTKAPARQLDSLRILMSGKSIPVGSSYFTGLQTLYAMNRILLRSDKRLRDRTRDPSWRKPKLFIASRPEEQELDAWHKELVQYWDVLFQVIPDLKKPPEKMRNDSGKLPDHIFFRPIGQEYVMAPVARFLLDASPDKEVSKVLAPMKRIPCNLREYPWKGLIARKAPVTEKRPDHWIICNENRPHVQPIALEFAKCLVKKGGEVSEADLFARWKEVYWHSSDGENTRNTWNKKIRPLLHL